MPLLDFLKQVAAELGSEILLRPPADNIAGLPAAVHDLYSVTDGVELPFAELQPSSQLRLRDAASPFGAGWVEFGFDRYFTHYLVRTNPKEVPPIAAFDPEVDELPEGAYTSVLHLLEEEYSQYVENDLHVADLHVVSIPEGNRLPQVVAVLKRAGTRTSSELLARLRTAPFVLSAVNSATAIEIVRTLQSLGVSARLKDVRPRPAG